jgi:uncharacterized membrane protein YfcA
VTPEAVTALAGLVASFLSGLLGIGGGLVLTPLLLYLPQLFGGAALPVKIVTGLTIVQAISGALLGLWRHSSYGNVSRSIVLLMGPPSALSALVGAFVSRGVEDRVLLLVFAALAFTGAIMLLLPPRTKDRPTSEATVNRPLAVAIAVVLGFFGGLVGIGGIAFILAALVYLLGVPVRIAIGTSLGIGIFAALAALVGKAATAQIDPPLAAIVFVAALVASPVGAAVSVRTQPRQLLLILAVVVALAAVRVAITGLTGD